MPLIKDQAGQKNVKNYGPALYLKQDTSKELFSDPKEIWDIKPTCEDDNLSSENETEPEDNHLHKPCPKIQPAEIYFDKKLLKKNVTFGDADCIYDGDFFEISSVENEYSDYEEFIQHGRVVCSKERIRPLTADPEKLKTENYYRQIRRNFLLKPHTCGHRPISTPIQVRSDYETDLPCRTRPCTLKCSCSNGVSFPKSEYLSGFYEDEYGCCECFPIGESTKPHLPFKAVQLPEQKIKRRQRDSVHQVYHTSVLQKPYLKKDPCYQDDGICEHAYGKTKKVLHNFEEMPAVEEQQEYFSDSTYKLPYSKIGKGIAPNFKKIPEKNETQGDAPAEWIYRPKKVISSEWKEKFANEVHPQKILKMRSRRTRMNRIKNGWKKAIVHTVREGSRNERVGLIVMGPKGPEFYSRASRKSQGYIPFRKTRSFPEGPTESYDPTINQECEKICASSSEPGTRAFLSSKNEEPLPFEETKLAEEIIAYSKNVDDLVKIAEDKFLKNLVNDEGKDVFPLPPQPSTSSKPSTVNNDIFKKAEAESLQADEKEQKRVEELLKMEYPPFHLLPFEALTPQVPKPLKIKESKDSTESTQDRNKSMAETLNEQAKHYKSNQNEDKIKEKVQKSPTTKISKESKESKESMEANLRLWGMKPEDVKENKDNAEPNKNREEKSSKISKDEESQTGSVKSSEQININKQRRKKYYESTTSKTLSTYYSRFEDRSSVGDAKAKSPRNQFEENSETGSEMKEKEERKILSDALQDLVNNGCAISEKASENLQNLLHQIGSKNEIQSGEASSSSTSSEKVRDNSPSSGENDVTRKAEDKENENKFKDKRKDEKRKYRNRFRKEGHARGDWSDEYRKSHRKGSESCDVYPGNGKKISRLKDFKDTGGEGNGRKKSGRKPDGKMKKNILSLEEKMKIIREALPSITAENEATHLKQLKKYINKFLDRAELRTSSSSETKTKNNKKDIKNKLKDSSSTDSSEVKVEAKRIIDIVSNPFKKIASDMTINIAKTLTDALVQESSTKSPKNISISTKIHKDSENESEENSLPCCTTIGSDRYEETEPTYLRQMKKMRNDHLSNIVMEVKRLNELLRFLDRWNRLKF